MRFAALTLIERPIVVVIDHFDCVDVSCQRAVCRIRQLADAVGLNLTMILATRECAIPAALQDTVELRIDIVPWTADETTRFVNTSVASAGSKEILFTDEALDSIHQATSGVPASVVALCNMALLATMSQDETLVTREIVEAANGELMPRSDESAARRSSLAEQPALTTPMN